MRILDISRTEKEQVIEHFFDINRINNLFYSFEDNNFFGFNNGVFVSSLRKRVNQTLHMPGNIDLLNHLHLNSAFHEDDGIRVSYFKENSDIFVIIDIYHDECMEDEELEKCKKRFIEDFGICSVKGISSTNIIDTLLFRKDYYIDIKLSRLEEKREMKYEFDQEFDRPICFYSNLHIDVKHLNYYD